MRADDISILKRKKRAAAAGRLLLGEFKNWQEFLEPETDDYDIFSRRDLKANISRFRTGISKEIQKFCRKNFEAMTEQKLEMLYLKIKERLGLEMPLGELPRSDFPNECGEGLAFIVVPIGKRMLVCGKMNVSQRRPNNPTAS